MITEKNPAILSGYSFTLEGLKISFIQEDEKITIFYDPKATTDILKQTGLIEDWTEDKNSEPVILFTDNRSPLGYGFEPWYLFVKSFPISNSLIHSIIERRQELNINSKFYGTIAELLRPLHAA